jgi:uncharacterized protein YceK
MRLSLILAAALALGGCATTRREGDAEARAYERGYRRAVQEQYWIIQNQQCRPPATDPANP